MSTENDLAIWTIYQNPEDYPGKFVARRSFATVEGPVNTDVFFVRHTLYEIRGCIPAGLYRMDRQPGDVPAIVETWF